MEILQDKPESLSADVNVEERQHNAEISANYQKFFCGNNDIVPEVALVRQYSPIEERKKIAESRNTLEEVRQQELKRQEQAWLEQQKARQETQYVPTYSAAQGAVHSEVFTSDHYKEAVLNKEKTQQGYASEVNLEGVDLKETVQEAVRTIGEVEQFSQSMQAVSADRAQWERIAKRAILIFAAAFIVLMAIIAVNSSVINGMDIEYAGLQQTLLTLKNEIAALQASITEQISPESVYAYIQAHGLIPIV